MHAKKETNVTFYTLTKKTKCRFVSSSNRMGFATNKKIVFIGTPSLKMDLQQKNWSPVLITCVAFASLALTNAFTATMSRKRFA